MGRQWGGEMSNVGRAREEDGLALPGLGPARVAAANMMPGGLSGARLERLALEATTPGGAGGYASRVRKRVHPREGWLGEASRDERMREVALWSSGILADLPAGIATGMLDYAESAANDAGTLLLRDLRARLLPNPTRTPPGRLPATVSRVLSALAHMHARYWADSRLRDPALGLMPPDAALTLTSPASVQQRLDCGDELPYLRLAAEGWDAFFQLATPRDAETLRAVQADPAPYVEAIERLPRTLVHGDVWGPNLGLLPANRKAPRHGRQMLLLDWALATAGPATYDPLWLCGTWHGLDPVRVLAVYRARLLRHLEARGIVLPPAIWRALVDAGYLRTALTCGEALGWAAELAPAGAARQRAEARARWWAARAARAADGMVPVR